MQLPGDFMSMSDMPKSVYIVLIMIFLLAIPLSSVAVAGSDGADEEKVPPPTMMPRASETLTTSPPEDFDYIITSTKVYITNYKGTGSNVVIPSEIEGKPVTSIGDNAFYNKLQVRSVVIPDSVTYIGNYAFYYCALMTSVNIPNNVTTIGDYAFHYCPFLTSINIPDKVNNIGQWAFGYCSSLTSVTIPASITYIGPRAFDECRSMSVMQFKGNAPSRYYGWDDLNDGIKVYYIEGAEGFDALRSAGIETIAVTVPGAPADLEAFAEAGNVTLTWNAPANVGEPMTYEVWYGTGANSSSWALFDEVSNLTVTITGLGDVTAYRFGVRAVNIAGASEFSTTFISAPDAPQVTAVAGDRRVELAWDVPYHGGAAIEKYLIYQDGAKVGETTGASFTINDLTNGQAYTFQVAAENIAGIGEKSDAVYATPRTVPSTPRDVMAALGDDRSSATLTWTAPDFDGGSEITGYEVWYRASGSSSWTVLTDVNALTIAIDGLEYGTTYNFGVKAVNVAGASSMSAMASVTTPISVAIPSAVPGLVYNGSEQTGVAEGIGYTLSDHKATDAGQYMATATLEEGYIWSDGILGAKIVAWSIAPKEVIVTPDNKAKVFGSDDPTLTYTLSEEIVVLGALNRTSGEAVGSYTISLGTMAAASDNYRLVLSGEVAFLTITADLPSAPEIIDVEPGDGRVELVWTAPAYNGGSEIIGYEVWYKTGEDGRWFHFRTMGASNLTAVVTGLENGREYSFIVAAKNGVGETMSSEVASTPLPAMVPISGKVVDADGKGIKGVKVSLKDGTSVTTGDDGSFTLMAPQGEQTLTFSGENMETVTRNVTVNGMELEIGLITAAALDDGSGGNAVLLVAAVGIVAAVIVAAFVFVRLKK